MPLLERWSSLPARYGAALACAVAAFLIRAAMGHDLGSRYPNAASFVAVLVAARFLGTGPAVLVLAAALGDGYILGHRLDAFREALFAVTAGLAVWIVAILRSAKAKAEEQARLAAVRLDQLEREAAQRRQEERLSAQLRAIVESSEDAILSKNLDGIIQSWNLGAEHIFGYSASEAIGQPIT